MASASDRFTFEFDGKTVDARARRTIASNPWYRPSSQRTVMQRWLPRF